MRKNITIFWFSLLIFLAGFSISANAAGLNAGFVNGIWYSSLPLVGGEEVRIYTAVQNQSGFDIIGKVQFFDGETLIGQSDFSVSNGSLGQSWADWKVTAGAHQIRAKIIDAKKCEIGKEPAPINFESSSFVDVQYAKPEPPKPSPPAESPTENPAPKNEIKNWFSSLFGSPSSPEEKSGAVSGAPGVSETSGTAGTSSVKEAEAGFFAAAIEKLEAEKARVEQKILKANESGEKNKESAAGESSVTSSATGSLSGVLEEITAVSSFDKAYSGLLGAAIFVMKWRWIFTVGALIVIWILWKTRKALP